MESRERVLTAVARREPDRVPCDYWAVPEVTERLCAELGLDGREALLEHLGVDLRYVEGPAFVGQERRVHADGSVEDLWGVRRRTVEVRGQFPAGGGCGRGRDEARQVGAQFTFRYKEVVEPPLARAETVREIEEYSGWPSADAWDYSQVAAQCEAHAGRAVVLHGNRLDRTAQLKTIMYLRGMEQTYIDLARSPALVEAMLARIKAYYLDYNDRVFRAAAGRADLFLMGDDFGTQTGPMMSLAMWRRTFRDGFRAFVELAHRHGLKVMHHSCGSVRSLVPEFIDAGLDILQALQPRAKGMDLAALKQEFGGHIAFAGGMDIQRTLPFGTPVEVEAEVEDRMRAAKAGGGYIIGTAHNLLPEVPTENILALFEAYRRHGGGKSRGS
jgi:uroporphyrinogen decarboxylase